MQFPARRKYLVGVSGGRDSVVLLDLLLAAGYRNLVVCHANHGLRGRASGADAAWVRRLAAKKGLGCEVAKLSLEGARGSVEAAAREARYGFFDAVAKRERCWRIFLAHHRDDQVETVLMNLCRGSGAGGLSGMRESSMRGRLELIRPLLGVWGESLAGYAEAKGLSWREDGSNATPGFTRNRVRLQLGPMLREVFGRDVRGAIARAADVLGEEDLLLGGLADVALEECRVGARDLDVGRVRELPAALQRRVVAGWLREVGIPDIGLALVDRVRQLSERGTRLSRVNLPGGGWARRRQGRLFVQG